MGTDYNTAPLVIKEVKVIGSRCGNFQMALDALQLGKDVYPVERLINKVYPFSEILEAIEHAKIKGTTKIQVVL